MYYYYLFVGSPALKAEEISHLPNAPVKPLVRTTADSAYIFESDLISNLVVGGLFQAVRFIADARHSDFKELFLRFSNKDVLFEFILPIFGVEERWTDGQLSNANELSLILKLAHSQHFCSLFFTRDADGINLACITGL
jgi:hypothetical protein